jgi:hypothetical protein
MIFEVLAAQSSEGGKHGPEGVSQRFASEAGR